jgi:hypothetical protein
VLSVVDFCIHFLVTVKVIWMNAVEYECEKIETKDEEERLNLAAGEVLFGGSC